MRGGEGGNGRRGRGKRVRSRQHTSALKEGQWIRVGGSKMTSEGCCAAKSIAKWELIIPIAESWKRIYCAPHICVCPTPCVS